MPDTARTRSALQALLADNLVEAISAQDLRDFLASVNLIDEVGLPAQELLYGSGLDAPFDVSPYAVDFDSTDGTDGTVNTITIPFLLAAGAPINLYNSEARLVKFADYTLTVVGSTTRVDFASTKYPIAGTIFTAIVTPA